MNGSAKFARRPASGLGAVLILIALPGHGYGQQAPGFPHRVTDGFADLRSGNAPPRWIDQTDGAGADGSGPVRDRRRRPPRNLRPVPR